MASRLAKGDMGVEDAFVSKIGTFLTMPDANAAAKTAVVEALVAIKPTEARPRWMSQLSVWQQMTKPKESPPVSTTVTSSPS